MPKRNSSRTPDSRRKASGDGYRAYERRRRSKSEWRVNAIDPDTLPVACEPCRCNKRGRISPLPYNLRGRSGKHVRTVEEIPEQEISEDLKSRIASVHIPGRPLPVYDDIVQLSQELKIRLAMVSVEVQENMPMPGFRYTYRSHRPNTRVIEIHDGIDEEYEHDVTLKIKLENLKKAGLWKRRKDSRKQKL